MYPSPPVPVDREPGILKAVDGPLTREFLRLPARKSANPLASPGGHVDPGETSREAAARELEEETGVRVNAADLRQLGVWDAPGRDPRCRYVTVAYLAVIAADTQIAAGDDARTARWWPAGALPQQLAFDHAAILAASLHGEPAGTDFTSTADWVRTSGWPRGSPPRRP
ncbi:NUDIX domain-containing protein [Kitasatospora sp. NPDC056531]|uniref:NUDIX domain-containing protein n=1 Tax=Kitasatospora sp. NPDC056531 TaxID=3345856 RepID=UPI0036746141